MSGMWARYDQQIGEEIVIPINKTERLTKKSESGFYILDKHRAAIFIYSNYFAGMAINKLARYENAEEDGRMLILPCKIGAPVFQISYSIVFGEVGDKAEKNYFISNTSFSYGMIPEFGRTVFLTKEEAEQKINEIRRNVKI